MNSVDEQSQVKKVDDDNQNKTTTTTTTIENKKSPTKSTKQKTTELGKDKDKEESKKSKKKSDKASSSGSKYSGDGSNIQLQGIAFDVDLVCEKFECSIKDPEQIEITPYIQAYAELIKFLKVLGKLLKFVSQDVEDKIKKLKDYTTDTVNGPNYRTVQSMIEFETKNKSIMGGKKDSGTLTLVRIHRGLEFIAVFLSELVKITDADSTTTVAQKAYDLTIARYQEWIVRQIVYLALYSLPSRGEMMIRFCGGKEGVERIGADTVVRKITRLAEIAARVHKAIEVLVVKDDLQKLP